MTHNTLTLTVLTFGALAVPIVVAGCFVAVALVDRALETFHTLQD